MRLLRVGIKRPRPSEVRAAVGVGLRGKRREQAMAPASANTPRRFLSSSRAQQAQESRRAAAAARIREVDERDNKLGLDDFVPSSSSIKEARGVLESRGKLALSYHIETYGELRAERERRKEGPHRSQASKQAIKQTRAHRGIILFPRTRRLAASPRASPRASP